MQRIILILAEILIVLGLPGSRQKIILVLNCLNGEMREHGMILQGMQAIR